MTHPDTDSRTQKEYKNYAEIAEETNAIFGFLFATSAKSSRLLRSDIRSRICLRPQ